MLSPDRWKELSPYLDEALTRTGGERAAWLEFFRYRNPELGELLEKLLDQHRSLTEEKFLEGGHRAWPGPEAVALQSIKGEPVNGSRKEPISTRPDTIARRAAKLRAALARWFRRR